MQGTKTAGNAANLSLQHRPGGFNRWTCALSLAANRASKIQLLRSDGTTRCDEIANRYEEHLRADVEAFLAKHGDTCPPLFSAALHREAGLS
jgi:hypothetical protein